MGDASSPLPQADSSLYVLPVRILTHNIRFATDTPEQHELLWDDRFPYLSSHFKFHTRPFFSPQATLVCMQEVLHTQLQDLHRRTFNTSTLPTASPNPQSDDDDWTYVGVGRDDGKTKGEYSPIFFRRSAWNCIHFETVWLNETGEVGKKGWDASSIRIMTCTVLESVLSPRPSSTASKNKIVLALNTHLDDQGEVSRREAAKLILQVASRLREKYAPEFTFLAGDLNSEPSGDAYKILNKSGSGFIDTRRLVPHDGNQQGKIYAYGNERTFTGFEGDRGAVGKDRIDFVHLGIPTGLTDEDDVSGSIMEQTGQMVQSYAVLPSRFDDKVWMSDHRGVVVDLLVPL